MAITVLKLARELTNKGTGGVFHHSSLPGSFFVPAPNPLNDWKKREQKLLVDVVIRVKKDAYLRSFIFVNKNGILNESKHVFNRILIQLQA